MTAFANVLESASINPAYQKVLAKLNEDDKDVFVSLLPQGVQQDFKNYIQSYRMGSQKGVSEKALGLAGERQALQYGREKEGLALRKTGTEARFGQAGKELAFRSDVSDWRNRMYENELEDQGTANLYGNILGGANVVTSGLAGYKKAEQDRELAESFKTLAKDYRRPWGANLGR